MKKKTFISLAITLTAILMLFNGSQSRYFEEESKVARNYINKDIETLSIENSQLWVSAPKEITFLCDNQEMYRITKELKGFTQDNFLESSTVNYPRIEFSDETIGEKINQLFYEMAMLHYDEELENEVNAFYSCDFFITFADEEYICIYFVESISAGMSSVTTYEDAVTVSLNTGDKVPLENFEDIDTIMKKIDKLSLSIFLEY